jgi:hypothetical protein
MIVLLELLTQITQIHLQQDLAIVSQVAIIIPSRRLVIYAMLLVRRVMLLEMTNEILAKTTMLMLLLHPMSAFAIISM